MLQLIPHCPGEAEDLAASWCLGICVKYNYIKSTCEKKSADSPITHTDAMLLSHKNNYPRSSLQISFTSLLQTTQGSQLLARCPGMNVAVLNFPRGASRTPRMPETPGDHREVWHGPLPNVTASQNGSSNHTPSPRRITLQSGLYTYELASIAGFWLRVHDAHFQRTGLRNHKAACASSTTKNVL